MIISLTLWEFLRNESETKSSRIQFKDNVARAQKSGCFCSMKMGRIQRDHFHGVTSLLSHGNPMDLNNRPNPRARIHIKTDYRPYRTITFSRIRKSGCFCPIVHPICVFIETLGTYDRQQTESSRIHIKTDYSTSHIEHNVHTNPQIWLFLFYLPCLRIHGNLGDLDDRSG